MQKYVSPPPLIEFSNVRNNLELVYARFLPIVVAASLLVVGVAAAYLLVNVSPIISIAAIFALPALLLIFAKPNLGLMLVVFVLPLEEINVKGGFSYIKFISVIVFGCAILHYLIFRRREPLARTTQNMLIGLFILASLLSIFVALSPSRTLERIPKLFRVLALYYFAINLIRSEKDFRIALWLFVIGGFASTLYGFFDPAQINGRFEGALGQPNGYALTMTPRIPIALALLSIEKNFLKKLFLIGMGVTIIYGIILSASRGGLLSLGLALILFAIMQKRRAVWLGLISLIIIVGILVMPPDVKVRVGLSETPASSNLENSTDRRLTYQIYGLELFREYPMLGIGLDGFAEAYAQSDYRFLIRTETLRVAHNTYLEIAAGTGLIGLIPFLGILGFAISLAWKYSRLKYHAHSSFLTSASAGLFAALGGYYWGMLFGSRQYEKTLWFLLALPVVLQILINAGIKYNKNSEQPQK
jgi:putative inorganic carbon (HCO3(-)) transporter